MAEFADRQRPRLVERERGGSADAWGWEAAGAERPAPKRTTSAEGLLDARGIHVSQIRSQDFFDV